MTAMEKGENTLLDASIDGAWQKRGSGHAYNSLSGMVYIS